MRSAAEHWYARRTSRAADWPVPLLQERKHDTAVSVVLPALDEEPTVGVVVEGVVELAERTGLVDEVVVMDSGSQDGTAAVAAAAGAKVYHRDDVLPSVGSRPGKGEVLWKSLHVTSGDLVVYLDADLESFGAHYVTGLLGPLLCEPAVALVKAFYDRPLLDVSPAGGGRVTELMARPLINALAPALAGVVQPLAGEYAARRSLLERLPFATGYAVEIALLIDAYREVGLEGLAQADLGVRQNRHQPLGELSAMAFAVLRAVAERLEREGRLSGAAASGLLLPGAAGFEEREVPLVERPPLSEFASRQ